MATLLLPVIVCAFLAGVQSTETIDLDNVWDIEKCPVPNGSCSGLWVGYRMYDRNHLESGQYVEVTDKWNNLTEAGYTSQLPTVVLIHGYANNINYYTLINIKNELLKSYDMFVMFLDWAKLVQSGCYLSAVYNVRYAGRCIADLVEALGRPQKGLHIIGFSLGAHVPASAADFLSPYKIPKITGLDPALPFFFGFPSQRRLRKSDGQFVDAIHTNAFIQGHFLPMGHVDFIVNGGIVQPGCGRSLIDIIMCSHERAPDYYTESINTKVGFWGCKSDFIVYMKDSCKDKDVKYLMGYHADPQLRGVVLLKTASHSPYALGKPKKENFKLNSTSEFIPFVDLIK